MGVFRKSTPRKSETKVIPDEKDGTIPYIEHPRAHGASAQASEAELINQEEGQLAVDVFQTADEIVVVAPVAGVKPSDLAINITDEVLTIKGARNFQFKAQGSDYFTQECFWGSFSRSIILPESVDVSNVKASFTNGILTVRIPKVEKIRTRMIKIQEE